MTNTDKWNNPH